MLPVIAAPITNDLTNEDLLVTEITNIVFPNSLGREGTEAVAKSASSQGGRVLRHVQCCGLN